MQDLIIRSDALLQGASYGYIYTDLDSTNRVTAVYFQSYENDAVYALNESDRLQVVTTDANGQVVYHQIIGGDVARLKNDSGNPLFAGMDAIFKI